MKNFVSKMFLSVAVIAFSLASSSCSNESVEDSIKKDSNPSALTLEQAEQQQSSTSKAANVYTIKKYIFNRSNGASGLGHVGVAFELKANINGVNYTSFYEGGVEGTNGWFGIPNAFTPAGSNNGGWWNQVSTQAQMINEFRARGYNRYKFGAAFISTTQAISDNSKLILARFPNRGYAVPSNNCMNACYDVIASFSGNNGNPSVPNQYLPNDWYNGLSVSGGWSNSNAM
jgi:hypothetical protein